ncbi:hypothetical protein [Pseudofrankia sp. BMG5.36]|uniref:hypothetical protein n=1 Tax=Pseudofrankia sp. BMG5.36 TaxID=1834512 RepID=UPI0008DB289F|nr:hypothetical protein [Pseudofrankia sp. BMG5.36]OHV62899.1 hypothetical protein BCD48_38855 [Pseudofrankia sp. BMG5.36]
MTFGSDHAVGLEVVAAYEGEWRQALRAASLVAELDVPDDQVQDVLRSLGRLYKSTTGSQRHLLLYDRYPAALVVGLAGVGARGYHHGNFWSGAWEAVGFRGLQPDQKYWAEAFRANLDRFGLARFPGLSRVYVDEILMHGGVPVYCLPDLLRLLIRRRRREPGVTGREVQSWVRAASESQLTGVDKPVLRFVCEGGDYATDFVDRCLDLVDLLALPDQVSTELAALGLPRRIVDEAIRFADTDAADLASLRRSRAAVPIDGVARQDDDAGATLAGRPHLRLEPYDNGVALWLPPVVGGTEDGRVVWHIATSSGIGSIQHRVRTRPTWAGSTVIAAETVLPLSEPVWSIEVRLGDAPLPSILSLVDKDDPLLVFTKDGLLIGPAESLPQGSVWLLHPAADPLQGQVDLAATGRELDEIEPPYGWHGWRLRHVDLTGVPAIGYADRLRPVHANRRAHLDLPAHLRDVKTAVGGLMFGTPPRLSLPVEGVPVPWTIRVRRPGAAGSLSTLIVTVGTEGDNGSPSRSVDPWADVPRPLLGSYELTVRGPLGRGLTRVVQLAEGLDVRATPPWREMGPRGLDPATLTVTCAAAGGRATVVPGRLELGGHEVGKTVTVAAHSHRHDLLVSAPHMAVRHAVPGDRGDWSFMPLSLHAETDARGELLVRLPANVPAELVVSAAGMPDQRIPRAFDRQTTVARFDLSRLHDTVTRHPRAVVDIDLVDGARFRVATFSPRRLATGLTVEPAGQAATVDGPDSPDGLVRGEALRADGFAGVSDAVAACYQLFAPWRESLLVALDSAGRAPLPPELRDAGPLLVMLRVDDPWLPRDWPDWPDPADRDDVYLLRDRMWRPPADSGMPAGEVELSAYLAGGADLPRSAGGATAALRLTQVAADLRRHEVPGDGRQAVASLLAARPAEALEASLTARLDAAALVAPLVEAGLAALPPGTYVSADAEWALWTASPLAALIAGVGQLRTGRPVGSGGPADPRRFDRGWVDDAPRREAQLDRLGAIAGESALTILDGGADRDARVSRFDENAVRFAAMPPAQLESLWRESAVVPGALLDHGTRMAAARRLFDARTRPEVVSLAGSALGVLGKVLPELERAPALGRAVASRRADDGLRRSQPWLALPELSMALAGLARRASRGGVAAARTYRDVLPAHVVLAHHAPDLVTIDLVLAELLLRGAAAARSGSAPAARPGSPSHDDLSALRGDR